MGQVGFEKQAVAGIQVKFLPSYLITHLPFQAIDKFDASVHDGRITAACMRLKDYRKRFQARAGKAGTQVSQFSVSKSGRLAIVGL